MKKLYIYILFITICIFIYLYFSKNQDNTLKNIGKNDYFIKTDTFSNGKLAYRKKINLNKQPAFDIINYNMKGQLARITIQIDSTYKDSSDIYTSYILDFAENKTISMDYFNEHRLKESFIFDERRHDSISIERKANILRHIEKIEWGIKAAVNNEERQSIQADIEKYHKLVKDVEEERKQIKEYLKNNYHHFFQISYDSTETMSGITPIYNDKSDSYRDIVFDKKGELIQIRIFFGYLNSTRQKNFFELLFKNNKIVSIKQFINNKQIDIVYF